MKILFSFKTNSSINLPAVTKRLLYWIRLWARPRGCFFLSCLATFGVWPLTLPARANDPWTFPVTRFQSITNWTNPNLIDKIEHHKFKSIVKLKPKLWFDWWKIEGRKITHVEFAVGCSKSDADGSNLGLGFVASDTYGDLGMKMLFGPVHVNRPVYLDSIKTIWVCIFFFLSLDQVFFFPLTKDNCYYY